MIGGRRRRGSGRRGDLSIAALAVGRRAHHLSIGSAAVADLSAPSRVLHARDGARPVEGVDGSNGVDKLAKSTATQVEGHINRHSLSSRRQRAPVGQQTLSAVGSALQSVLQQGLSVSVAQALAAVFKSRDRVSLTHRGNVGRIGVEVVANTNGGVACRVSVAAQLATVVKTHKQNQKKKVLAVCINRGCCRQRRCCAAHSPFVVLNQVGGEAVRERERERGRGRGRERRGVIRRGVGMPE